jgi:hypothetical protein
MTGRLGSRLVGGVLWLVLAADRVGVACPGDGRGARRTTGGYDRRAPMRRRWRGGAAAASDAMAAEVLADWIAKMTGARLPVAGRSAGGPGHLRRRCGGRGGIEPGRHQESQPGRAARRVRRAPRAAGGPERHGDRPGGLPAARTLGLPLLSGRRVGRGLPECPGPDESTAWNCASSRLWSIAASGARTGRATRSGRSGTDTAGCH